MNKRWIALGAVVATSTMLLAACGSSGGSDNSSSDSSSSASATGVQVGVILPDTESSARWENNDRPYLTTAFKAAGVGADIQNANGSVTKFQTLCDGMINEGVKVLMTTNLDSASGAACLKKAQAQGIKTIDYDRLTLGGKADYYVSFDNVAVGTAIGTGLVKCLQDDGVKSGGVVELNGSPTDNNATLFKQGYHKVITDAGYTILTSQAVPDWNNTKAGTLFEQIFTNYGTKIKGVASANDGLGGAVASVLARNNLSGKIPITGQDATDEGLQRVLLGTQCVTVYKSIKLEAGKAAALAVSLAKGDASGADSQATGSVDDTQTKTQVKSVLLTPVGIYPDNVKDVVADGFTTAAKLCTTSALKTACTKYGVS
jgi:D-xylose transport system substrate-binding protein